MAQKTPKGIRYSKRDNGYIVNLRKYGGGEPVRKTLDEAKALLEHAAAEHRDGGFIPQHTSPAFAVIAGKFVEHEETRVRRSGGSEGQFLRLPGTGSSKSGNVFSVCSSCALDVYLW